jgi:hypothetical protein
VTYDDEHSDAMVVRTPKLSECSSSDVTRRVDHDDSDLISSSQTSVSRDPIENRPFFRCKKDVDRAMKAVFLAAQMLSRSRRE